MPQVFMVKLCPATAFITFFKQASSLFDPPQYTVTFSRVNGNTFYVLTYMARNLPLRSFLTVARFERVSETFSLRCLNILPRKMLKKNQFGTKCPGTHYGRPRANRNG